jgi:V8-like Glu-specific endopeptidase
MRVPDDDTAESRLPEFDRAQLQELLEETRAADRHPLVAQTLHRIATRSAQFSNTEEWRNTMAARERAVCRIEFPEHMGQATGFVVAPDLVMTSHHVLEPFVQGRWRAADIRCRFGYRLGAGNRQPYAGVATELARDWLVTSSPTDQLDYVVVRLETPAPSGPDGITTEPLTPVAHRFQPGESVFIIQHPRTAPLQVTSGGVVKVEARRVFYLAATLRGSSGSPCFSERWELVALHRGSEEMTNVGVPFAAILDDLDRRGLGGALGR